MTDQLPGFVEAILGPITQGWKCTDDVFIVRFDNQPFAQAKTFATLGLHRHLLQSGEREYRQELLFCAWDDESDEALCRFLAQFVYNVILRDHQPLLRGEVVGPSSPLLPESAMTAVCASIPVVFDEQLTVYRETTPPTVFVWLIPIRTEEAQFIHQQGWDAFEERLEAANPDLLDFQRQTVVGR
ncbi:MAG: Suppressor of fused protein (SUFU) [bacterium ADurb.Bin429]|nr:MAG: Suppressor of fused protein (SUFU) [bacterium ADurb.Bin429]